MKEEYDFSQAEQGKFYRPLNELELPVYLDSEVSEYLKQEVMSLNNTTISELVNTLLKNDIEIAKKLA